jgi:uncharacterized protein (TIGR02145 family)
VNTSNYVKYLFIAFIPVTVLVLLIIVVFNRVTIQVWVDDMMFNMKSSTSEKQVNFFNQTWMTHNLDVTSYNNGDLIPQCKNSFELENASRNKIGAWCYYNFDESRGAKFGKLYNWYAVSDERGIAPDGYHIPSDEEWQTLESLIGMSEHQLKSFDRKNRRIGRKLIGFENLWNSADKLEGVGEYGFLATPSGKYADGFSGLCVVSNWWTATELSDTNAISRSLKVEYSSDELLRGSSKKENFYSIRLIKD